jgi:aromatic-L-amino-acid/L-tryptophan decarboxylase
MDTNEFRRVGHELIDWVADYRAHVTELPVMSRVQPGDVASRMPAHPPQKGEGLASVAADLDTIVLPGITHWNHPGFFAYFPSNSDLVSVLADLISSGLGVQGMSWQTSPAATEVEDVVMEWLRQMLGLSQAFSGVIHDSASTATLCALLCARERTSEFAQNRGGLQAEAAPLVVYASDQAHSSVPKAALLAGFGADHLRLLATDDDHAMRPDLFEAALRDDLAAGRRPCAVVAAVGTTATTALDPLPEIAAVARQHHLWLHVDAALAGSAMICPENRWMWEGIEHADSVVLNPHKWMGTGFDLSAYFVRDPQHLVRVMSTNPSYLRTAQDGLVRNLRDWGLPLGRRFRALKLWFLIREHGVEGLQARVRRDMANAQWLKQQVDAAAPAWQRLAPVPLQTVCVRHVPAALRGDRDDEQHEAELAAHNLAICDGVNQGGRYYLTPSLLKGRQMIRISIGAQATERDHVAGLWRELQQTAQQIESAAGTP